MTSLFDSFQLEDLRLPNRVVMAPMTRARATTDGLPTPSMATYYAQRATAGLIISEGVQPSLQGQSNPYTPGLQNDAQVEAWREVTAAVHANGGRIFAQIMHGGRVAHSATVGHHPVAPSPVALQAQLFTGRDSGMLPAPTPRPLATHEVPGEAQAYADAARRAVDAGFDGVELHGANGYLIQQFLSSNVNQRTDAYGGSIAGRIRFAVEAVEATADAIGPQRVGIRLSPATRIWDVVEDDVPGLYGALLNELATIDIAYIHAVASADDDTLVALRKAWPNAFIVNPSAGIVGQQADGDDAQRWLSLGADLISLGRAFIGNPDLVERLRLGLPLHEADPATYYQGDDGGYLDYRSYKH